MNYEDLVNSAATLNCNHFVQGSFHFSVSLEIRKCQNTEYCGRGVGFDLQVPFSPIFCFILICVFKVSRELKYRAQITGRHCCLNTRFNGITSARGFQLHKASYTLLETQKLYAHSTPYKLRSQLFKFFKGPVF